MPLNLAELLDDLLVWAKEAASFLVELQPLTLSSDEAVEGVPIAVDIIGATNGGRVICTPPDGTTFDPATLMIAGIPTTVGEYDISLRETHPQGSNSPKVSVVRFRVTAKPIIPVDLNPYTWGDPRLSWGQSGIAWGQSRPDGNAPVTGTFWSDPFWTRPQFWGAPSQSTPVFFSDPFWTRANFWSY